MEDLNTIHEIYRADKYLGRGKTVLDLGSEDGKFSDWAESRGAKAFRVDIRGGRKTLPFAVGRSDGTAYYAGESTGTHVVQDSSLAEWFVSMISLQTLLDFLGKVDVIKCDIEGSEYEVFEDVDLTDVEFITIEFHAWTTPDEDPVPGLGVRTGEKFDKNAVDKLVATLSNTHQVEIVGDKLAGGYLYCTNKLS